MIRSSVTDPVSGRHFTNERDSRFPGHDRLHQLFETWERRDAIKNEASSNNVERWIGISEHTRARQDVGLVIAGKFSPQLFTDPANCPSSARVKSASSFETGKMCR